MSFSNHVLCSALLIAVVAVSLSIVAFALLSLGGL
jgi:hypothetical protein